MSCAPAPGFVAPWAATTIGYFPSFLIIHGLLFLANRNVCKFQVPIAAQFIDLVRHMDDHWDMLVSCIRDGTIPDLEGIDHVRQCLQASRRLMNIHDVIEALRRFISIPIQSARQNWVRSGLLQVCPLRVGSPEFGQKRPSFGRFAVALLLPCFQRCV